VISGAGARWTGDVPFALEHVWATRIGEDVLVEAYPVADVHRDRP
jgi:hypothetical protein